MATGSRKTRVGRPNCGRVRYRFKADQVLRMIAEGIIPDFEDVELFDGVLYKLTKGELHNCIVGLIGDALRPLTPAGFHLREEKSARKDEYSLPEPDVAVCRGKRTDYVPDPPPLGRLALVAEVDHHSREADCVDKVAAYAGAGIPTYWIVDAVFRTVEVCSRPMSLSGAPATYRERIILREDQAIEVTIDDQTRGQISMSDLFPPA
jgi:Uma2 family endonuclease